MIDQPPGARRLIRPCQSPHLYRTLTVISRAAKDPETAIIRLPHEPVDTAPPVPSFPGLLVLLSGGLLLPGLPVALGAIRSSNSSTSSRISSWSFILFHLLSFLGYKSCIQ